MDVKNKVLNYVEKGIFITEHEKKVTGDLAMAMALALMFGNSVDIEVMKAEAYEAVEKCFANKAIDKDTKFKLYKLIGTDQKENIKLAMSITIAKTNVAL